MSRFLKYLLVGIAFVVPGEFLINIVALEKGASAYLAALVLYSVLLSISYGLWHITKRVRNRGFELLLWVAFFGTAGLMAEWFLIGNSPWQNPAAFQLGMFSWWASLFTMPRLSLEGGELKNLKRWALGAYLFLSAVFLFVPFETFFGGLLLRFGLFQFFVIDLWYIKTLWRNSS